MESVNKKLIKIFLLLFVLGLSTTTAFAQKKNINLDTALMVSISNYQTDASDGTFSFDIYVTRISSIWHLWTNASFQLEVFRDGDKKEQIDYSNFEVELDWSRTEVLDGNLSPYYNISADMFRDPNGTNSRLGIFIIGPDDAFHSKYTENAVTLYLCSVRLRAKKSTTALPVNVDWKKPLTPYPYYQSCAYKYIEDVNKVPVYHLLPSEEDNIEIAWATKFITPPTIDVNTEFAYFTVEYIGNLNSVCRFASKKESRIAGYFIRRGEVDREMTIAECDLLPDSLFNVEVASYKMPEWKSRLSGMEYSYTGKEYDPVPDKVTYRMMYYVYRLYYERSDYPDESRIVGTRPLLIPNSVIATAEAYPNPSSGKSYIRYEVDDDVYLTCEVFDQNGKSIKKLSDNANGLLDGKYVPKGKYVVEFIAPTLASQGMYDVNFLAYPINDKSIEISTANVKIQLIRGISNE